MSGDSTSGHGERPQQQTSPYDAERARQAQQAESPSGIEHGGELEPRDSRDVTGAAGAGTGTPGGADQQEGAARWGGQDAAREVAAQQPDGTTAAGQQPGIDRRELQAEQQAQQQQQSQGGGGGMSQSLGGMSQSLGGGVPSQAGQQGYVDQQAASLAGSGGELGSDEQVEAVLGVGQENQSAPGGGQAGGGQAAGGQAGDAFAQVREHMEVVGADGVHLGTVDAVEGDRIKLTKRDSDAGYEGGQHHGHHHYISRGLVAAVEGDRVRLSATAANAYALEEER